MPVLPALRSALRFWEWPFLAALACFMFWVRMLPYQALAAGERVYYVGTDPYYHYRAVLGIVHAFPNVPRWDPWTFYPNGTATGQFASLFDWVVALAAVATSGGEMTDLHIMRTLAVAPAVAGAILIVPFYFLAKRFFGIAGAVVASIAIAVFPGEFLIRSIAGYSDHHVAEALMAVVAILAVVVAVERAHAARDALAHWKDVRGYRGPLAWALIAGVALAALFYTWPPGLLFMAVLTLWLTIVIMLEHGAGRTPRGMVFAASVAFVTAGALMVPAIETTNLGEFNTYGILHPIASALAALWLIAVHRAGRELRLRGVSMWALPGSIAALAVAGFFAVRAVAPGFHKSMMWGLSWVTGIGVQRTTLTIAEARPAKFFCSETTQAYSCFGTAAGILAPLAVILFFALAAFVLWKRRRHDILLLIWSAVAFRATTTQIRFSYYAALNIALLVGWLAARAYEAAGAYTGANEEAPIKGPRGRKTRHLDTRRTTAKWWQAGAASVVVLLIIPGNILANDRSFPGWESAAIRNPDSDLVMWTDGLEWMRANTPDAGVDLGLVIPKPRLGEEFDYPDAAYGVLSWWDYGHWIETLGRRPPVANPFQQAAPFASLWFTERDPAAAERALDAWTRGHGPVRYIMIDDAMATGKFGAITVWANSQNESRPRWAGGEFVRQTTYELIGGGRANLATLGPAYTQSMMGRLYDEDAYGLPNYRLVWEHPSYTALGSVTDTNTQRLQCLHDVIPSRGCPFSIPSNAVIDYRPGTAIPIGKDLIGYDLRVQSRLKIFERVPGAQLEGVAEPGARVTAATILHVTNEAVTRSFIHEVHATADASGNFVLVVPYATTDPLSPAEGGTATQVVSRDPVRVTVDGRETWTHVPERAVLHGETVRVEFST